MSTTTALAAFGVWLIDRLTAQVFRAIHTRRLDAAKAAKEAAK